MNYLQYKLLICQEIPKHALLLLMNETSLTDEELRLKLGDALKFLIDEKSISGYNLMMQSLYAFYVIINEYSESFSINTSKVSKSIKFIPTDTDSFTEYIANIKSCLSKKIEILQEIYSQYIVDVLVGNSEKINIDELTESYEEVIALLKEPIKFNIVETSSSSAVVNAIVIDHSLPIAIIELSSSDNLVEFKFATSKRIKINKSSKSTIKYYATLYELFNLGRFNNMSLYNIDDLELDQFYGREI